MYEAGQPEIDAIARVIRSKKLFRYTRGSQCARFESRWSRFLGVRHAHLTSSGTAALTAAVIGLGLGPGDEVLVPAHTYMATAVAVLAAGAIPVIVDIDTSLTISPEAAADAVGPRTRGIIPVHMWGLPADMDPLLRLARRRKLLVLEDACQAVGGSYRGRKLGSLGHAGAFSFNYFKNISCGEGGCLVTGDDRVFQAAVCQVDCCGFYWTGRDGDTRPFVASGSRASEIEGAMLNAQLTRLRSILRRLRAQKSRILRETSDLPNLTPIPSHDPAGDCGSMLHWLCPTPDHAARLAKFIGGGIAGRTGRHNSSEWDPVLAHRGHRHPALDPFRLPANRRCRKDYSLNRWEPSLSILNRTVMLSVDPSRSDTAVARLINKIRTSAKQVLE